MKASLKKERLDPFTWKSSKIVGGIFFFKTDKIEEPSELINIQTKNTNRKI